MIKKKSYTPPKYASLFIGYNRKSIAEELNINYQYLCNILTGYLIPNQKVKDMLIAFGESLQNNVEVSHE